MLFGGRFLFDSSPECSHFLFNIIFKYVQLYLFILFSFISWLLCVSLYSSSLLNNGEGGVASNKFGIH